MTAQHTLTTGEQTSVAQLVRAAQRGHREAFGELVERYQRAAYAIAYRRLGNHAEAQELCQEVFIQALRKIHQLRDPCAIGGWLRSITHRMAINRAMRRGPMLLAASKTFETACIEHETPLGAVLSRERNTQVHLGLGRLRTTDRDTLVAFYFDGRTLVETSDQFDAPVGTIKRRLHVARKRLAKELQALAPA